MSKLLLIRGLPGSGKSTLAKNLLLNGFYSFHYEADMFFVKDGVYTFNQRDIGEAHNWCRRMTDAALSEGYNVIVSNTFSMHWEMAPYYKIGRKYGAVVETITCTGSYGSIHGVPEEVIQKMKDRWEE